ncbi:MAG: GNAT family N-acetyltransferase [Pseudohongiella sp.]|nr:GNAT family N-acetyltransferase [Pseudohongiella sp.]
MKFEFLTDRPEALKIISYWYYEEWGRWNPKNSVQSISKKLLQSMNKDKVPLILLAIDRDDVVGAVELKYREMDIYPDKEHWLGGLFVEPRYRGAGVGKRLIDQVITLSSGLGINKLHLQTERLDGGVYARLGWRPVEQIDNNGIKVLVMERDVGV